MEKQVAVIVGVGAVATAILGGLGWKTLKHREGSGKLTAEQQEQRKAELRARLNKAAEPVEVVLKELSPESLRASGDPVLGAIAGMMVETTDDVVATIDTPKGPLASVSRIRAVTQPDQTPKYWSNFVGNIKRPDVLVLTSEDFNGKNSDMAKGYHNCTVDGVAGVLHVTKSNVSAVLHMGGDSFSGISTSASRFGGKGLNNLTVEQAKNFLNGR